MGPELKICAPKQLQGEIRALEIRKGTTIKAAFSDLTVQSHITDEPGLDLPLDIHMQAHVTLK